MGQTAKIIGLWYEGETYYAMFINMAAFDLPEEIRVLGKFAGIDSARASKYLLISPLDRSCHGGELVFSSMPGNLQPREPYLFASGFVREKWGEIRSGDVLDIEAITRRGLSGDASDCIKPRGVPEKPGGEVLS